MNNKKTDLPPQSAMVRETRDHLDPATPSLLEKARQLGFSKLEIERLRSLYLVHPQGVEPNPATLDKKDQTGEG